MKQKGTLFSGNSRKKTRGRNVGTTEFTYAKEVKSDKGFTKHTAIKHLISEDPKTGQKVYAKQGKAIEGDFVVTLRKGTTLKRIIGSKFWKEQEGVLSKARTLFG